MMKSFSFNRFCKMFRWYLSVNLRSLLMWTGGYVIAVFLGELMFFGLSENNSQEHILRNIEQFCTIFAVIALTVGLATLFADYNKIVKREAFLMLPASNLEKFLSAVIYATVVWALSVFVSLALGDTLRMVFRGLAYSEKWLSIIPMMLETLPQSFLRIKNLSDNDVWFDFMRMINITSVFLWIHSVYILGGTLLRKYSFVATSLFIIICCITFFKAIYYFHFSMFSVEWDGEGYVSKEIGFIPYVLAVALPLISIFNYWASFHIFKGFQLITNKWTNYDFFK